MAARAAATAEIDAALGKTIRTRNGDLFMSNDLVLYTHPMSRGRIIRWMLEEIGQPYRAEILGYGDSP